MNSLLRRVRPPRAAWACRRCYTTPVDPVENHPDGPNESPKVKIPARTRFAPSPTGFLHLGSLRTALFNYLLARNTGGQFILRIEDTDKKRTVLGAEENIIETLRWAGLQWDEGPQVGGEYGPYKQSERSDLHRSHAHTLLSKGHAYRCFCGPKRLEALALKRQADGLPAEYDRYCYKIPPSKSDSRAARGEPHVIRLKVPDEYPSFTDAVYGPITYGANASSHAIGSFEDPVLLKSDGMPTYHLANVVDDHFMKITHVLRASEWMPSTPKHMHLYNCFGWEPPQWVHVGLLQDKSHAKLSKRSGSVMVNEYREAGYTPETLLNFVALLGWSHGGGGRSDVMRLDELVELFNIEQLTRGNTVVNFEKLDYLQKSHARRRVEDDKTAEEELDKVEKAIREAFGDTIETGAPLTRDYIRTILKIALHNYDNPTRFATITSYFFTQPTFDQKFSFGAIRSLSKFFKLTGCSVAELYHGFLEEVEKIPDTPEDWTVENLKKVINFELELDEEAWQFRMRMLRLALAAGASGPSMADTMWVLGKRRCLQRFRAVDEAFERPIVIKDGAMAQGEPGEEVKESVEENLDEEEEEEGEGEDSGEMGRWGGAKDGEKGEGEDSGEMGRWGGAKDGEQGDEKDERKLKKWEVKVGKKKTEKRHAGKDRPWMGRGSKVGKAGKSF